MKEEFQALCQEAVTSWDSTGDIEPIIDKMRLALALSPSGRRKARQQPRLLILPLLPAFAEPYRPLLQEWWELRCKKYKNAERDSLSNKTLDALALAHKLDVLQEFCEYAAEKDWMSLGFVGHTDYLQKLAKDKKFTTSGGQQQTVQSRFTAPPPVNMETHPSYRPLVTDDEQFF